MQAVRDCLKASGCSAAICAHRHVAPTSYNEENVFEERPTRFDARTSFSRRQMVRKRGNGMIQFVLLTNWRPEVQSKLHASCSNSGQRRTTNVPRAACRVVSEFSMRVTKIPGHLVPPNMAFLVFLALLSALPVPCLLSDSLTFLAVGDWGGKPTAPYTTEAETKTASSMGITAEKLESSFQLSLGDNFYSYGVKNVEDERFNETFEVRTRLAHT